LLCGKEREIVHHVKHPQKQAIHFNNVSDIGNTANYDLSWRRFVQMRSAKYERADFCYIFGIYGYPI
jgi:hypothetical protein